MHVLWALLVAAQTSVSRAPLPSPAPDTAHFVSRQDSTVLRVLALNDFHGALEARSWPWSHGRAVGGAAALKPDRKSTRLNSSHSQISYAVFCLKKKTSQYI